ncbi:DUF5722 domain-containing protein [Rubinisphaera sp. JC750]|uniref:DUF5722 domain-containing protein n=1 Tax=Rubinisphaera sp. JC750 TaxID=2898658 RepID=UPI001F2DCD81|nr:DUF5722 domain-containing protein [Rubinisphaera sp. JC750]
MCFVSPVRFVLSVLALILATGSSLRAAAPVELKLGPRADIQVTREDNAWQIETEGENPHFWTNELPADIDVAALPILEFEYFSTAPIENVRVRVPTANGGLRIEAGTIGLAETWQTHAIDLRQVEQPYLTGPRQRFAVLLGTKPGHVFRLRTLRLRAANAAEEQSQAERNREKTQRLADARAYETYLTTEFPATITSTLVKSDEIRVTAQVKSSIASDKLGIVEVPLHTPSYKLPEQLRIEAEATSKDGQIEFRLLRSLELRDRASSRWRLVSLKNPTQPIAVSPVFYANQWDKGVQRDLPPQSASSIKGLGAIPRNITTDHEVFELGIQHATVNIVVNSLVRRTPTPSTKPYVFEGQTFHINSNALASLDKTVHSLTQKNVINSAILLIGNGRDEHGRPLSVMIHPEAESQGRFVMPNLATTDGTTAYRAVIYLLTERYTRPDGQFGRISNWILHNEIDQSGTWTNMGAQPLLRYLETFTRSARIVYQTARRFDPHARVFVSLTHFWTRVSPGHHTFQVREIIERFNLANHVEGPFEWGIAYHPYPEPMRQPQAWTNHVDYTFDADFILPANIEVLTTFLQQPRFLFQGKLRGILLSEQGVNAASMSDEDQLLQAAGIAWVMSRVRKVKGIEAYHYHAYRDSPEAEGGLLLGLTNPNSGHKHAWDIYAAFDTPSEEEAFRFAWPIIGISGPEQIELHPVAPHSPAQNK